MKMIEGKCDVCEQLDDWRGQNLQRCKVCHVLVHERCYGMVPTATKNPNFTCHACNAVGKEVKVNVPSRIGGSKKIGKKHDHMKQAERPSECVLCSHDKGIHAMHPLLDTHGPEGRQFVLPAQGDGIKRKEKRLAWVHTLCASTICSNPQTAGCVYGCFKDKSYEGEEDEGESSSDNSGIDDDDEESITEERALCYFAIAGKDSNGDETPWSRQIKHNCDELKCFICGRNNKNRMIPVQCIAGDEGETNQFRRFHTNLYVNAGTECSVAMHVGCARWGYKEKNEGDHLEIVNGRKCKLSYFTPGYNTNEEETVKLDEYGDEVGRVVAQCYCKAHGREIIVNNPKYKRNKPSSTVRSAQSSSSPRRTSDGNVTRRRLVTPCRKSPEASRRNPHSQERTGPVINRSSAISSIRPRGGNHTLISRKRKSSSFGTTSMSRKNPAHSTEDVSRFAFKGRAASALGSSSKSPGGKRSSKILPDLQTSGHKMEERKQK